MNILIYFPELRDFHMQKDVGEILFNLRGDSNVTSCQLATNKVSDHVDGTLQLSLLSVIMLVKRYDILILYHFTLTSLLVAFLARITKRNVKIIVKSDIDMRYLNYLSKSRTKFVFKLFELLFDLILVETQYHSSQLSSHLKNKNKAFLLNNGSKLSSDVLGAEDIEKKNEILFVGRLGLTQKNVPYLLRLLNEAPKIKGLDGITLLGELDGPNRSKIQRLLVDLRSKYSVRVIPPITDQKQLAREYRRARALVMPSLYESFGLVVAEAITQGTCVISHEVGIAVDLAPKTPSVQLVVHGDENGWLEKIAFAMKQNEDFALKGTLSDSFDWSKICTKLCKKLKTL